MVSVDVKHHVYLLTYLTPPPPPPPNLNTGDAGNVKMIPGVEPQLQNATNLHACLNTLHFLHLPPLPPPSHTCMLFKFTKQLNGIGHTKCCWSVNIVSFTKQLTGICHTNCSWSANIIPFTKQLTGISVTQSVVGVLNYIVHKQLTSICHTKWIVNIIPCAKQLTGTEKTKWCLSVNIPFTKQLTGICHTK